MGKLFKLKAWVTVADAAKHLSTVFDEPVSEADVLRFALDDELQLSAYFVNEAYSRVAKLVPLAEAAYEDVSSPFNSDESIRVHRGPSLYTNGRETHILEFEDDISPVIEGVVYDLPMIGGEANDVETRYQLLTGGPNVTSVAMDGAFIKFPGGQLAQMQGDYEDNPFCAGSRAQLARLKRAIDLKEYGETEATGLLDQYRTARLKFTSDREKKPIQEHFYPLATLPDDAVLVVRMGALGDFIKSVNNRGQDDLAEAPFFDADSDEYPQLLHIAVRAWEHARSVRGGTPKQRIAAYVADRYPQIHEGTREAIAMVANWQRSGGRPKTGE